MIRRQKICASTVLPKMLWLYQNRTW